ncbi:MAG: hypothetical protein JSS65_04365 [Armatimonadetes bacterium]|nr:hypothetical protein [Armatimonadota bacterium]
MSAKGARLEVVYTLHPTAPAFHVSITCTGEETVEVRFVDNDSPFVRQNTSTDTSSSEPNNKRPFILFRNSPGYETDFTLGDKDVPRYSKRLEVPHVQIEGDDEAAAALNGMIARLVGSYRAGQCWGPFGLTDGKYNGRAFWDLDVWVQPAMVFLDRETAQKAAEWRLSCLPQAKKNYDAWVKAGRPVSDKKKLADISGNAAPDLNKVDPGGALFAWESAMDGTELSTAPTRFEHHISGSVALGLRFAQLSELVTEEEAMPVYLAAKTFYWSRSFQHGEGGRRIPMTVSPDEWHVVDNDLYTNEIANWVHKHGQWADEPYQSPPRVDGAYLAFDGDEMRGYQQASALLAVWPLGAITDRTEIGKMYDRFVGKEAPQGPAMTKSLNALIAARLGRTDEAYKQWVDSWKLYTDDPALRFREKQKVGDGYFLTGAAGCVNAFIYGFLGLSMEPSVPPNRDADGKLHDSVLHIRTLLPKHWKHVVVDGLWVQGKRIRLEVGPGNKSVLSEIP